MLIKLMLVRKYLHVCVCVVSLIDSPLCYKLADLLIVLCLLQFVC